MIGTNKIYKTLSTSSTILTLLTQKNTNPNYIYNIEVTMVEPNNWEINNTSIIIYQINPNSLTKIYNINHTINYQTNTKTKTKTLTQAITTTLHHITFSQIIFYCTLKQPIAPANNTNNFNTPITIHIIKSK